MSALGTGAALSVPGSAGAADEFVVGSGRADAAVLRVGPSAGKLAIAPTVGLTIADFLGSLGRGEARLADLGALEVALPPEVMSAVPVVTARSTDEVPEKSNVFAGTPAGTPVTVGAVEQKAKASKTPSGESTVNVGVIALPNIVEISGGQSNAFVRVIDRKTREARGVSHIGAVKLGGGVVTLRGLTWEAVQRTGEGATVDASFRVEGATVAGRNLTIPVGGAELATVLEPINRALAPTGLVLDPPRVSKENGVARVTPLAVRVVNSQLGNLLAAPIIGAAQPIREPIVDALISNCAECAVGVLLADVVLGVVSGSGRLDLELGGASSTTEGEAYASPFDFDFAPSLGGGASGDLAGGFADAGSTSDLASSTLSLDSNGDTTGDLASSSTTPVPADAQPGAATTDASSSRGATSGTLAASTGVDGKTGGAAALIGLFGLLGALSLAAADYRAIRAARRTIPTL